MKLDEDRGRPSWLEFGYDVKKLDYDGRKTYSAGEIEDYAEWPISLM